MRKTNTIEINGKRYDAGTGELVTPGGHPIVRQPAHSSARHRPARPRTLMRHTVKKPAASPKRHHLEPDQKALAVQPASETVSGLSSAHVDAKRLRRARQISRSRAISRFAPLKTLTLPPAEVPISLPKPAAERPHVPKPHASHHQPVSHKDKLLNDAIERSTSHLQPPPPKSRHNHLKRRASMGAAVVLSVAVLGLIVVQNLSGVRLQMASAKAGFDASLPTAQPAGFDLNKLNYSPGVVAARFDDGSRHYTITQKQSNWDNQALLNNFVAADYPDYRTVAADGHVIYLYGNHDATWVNGGVWYVVQSDGSLSDQQLIDLAATL